MHLEEGLQRLQEIISEMEGKQLPLHEVMQLHEEGQKLVAHSEKLLNDAKGRLKVTEVGVDSAVESVESPATPAENSDQNTEDISLF